MQITRDEFLNSIKTSNSSLFCIVGPNYSGKTYLLKNFFENYITIGGLLIDETGKVRRKVATDEIFISSDNNYYIYQDKKQRGKDHTANDSKVALDEASKEIIKVVKKYKDRIINFLQNGKPESLGISKIMNIINILLSTNLNNISYVIIDEPENSLDDNNLKIVIEFINTLILFKKKVVIVTHSPRLLELMKVEVDNIYKVNDLMGKIQNLKFTDVEKIYIDCGSELKEVPGYKSLYISDIIQFNAGEIFRNLYINYVLKSQDFYRVLFYNDIVLMEGKTEEFIIRETKYSKKYSKNVYYMEGKYKAYFLIELFSNYCNQVNCFMDMDKKSKLDDNNNFSYQMNDTFKRKYKNNLKVKIFYFNNNIEDELGVDINEVMIDFVGEENKNNERCKKNLKPFISLRYLQKHPECIENLDSITNEFDF